MSEYRIAKNIMDGFVKEKILPHIKNAKIIDNGPGVLPRYEIEAPFDDNDHIPGVSRPGNYYIDIFTPNPNKIIKIQVKKSGFFERKGYLLL